MDIEVRNQVGGIGLVVRLEVEDVYCSATYWPDDQMAVGIITSYL